MGRKEEERESMLEHAGVYQRNVVYIVQSYVTFIGGVTHKMYIYGKESA